MLVGRQSLAWLGYQGDTPLLAHQGLSGDVARVAIENIVDPDDDEPLLLVDQAGAAREPFDDHEVDRVELEGWEEMLARDLGSDVDFDLEQELADIIDENAFGDFLDVEPPLPLPPQQPPDGPGELMGDEQADGHGVATRVRLR